MIGGILATHRFTGPTTQTVWVVPGPNLRFIVDIIITRFSDVPGGGPTGITDLLFGKIGESPRFIVRAPLAVHGVTTVPSIVLSTGDSVLIDNHQEDANGFQTTKSVNIWVIGREIFKSDFFEVR